MDVRYSFLPNQIKSMWGITLDQALVEKNIDVHVDYDMSSRPDKITLEKFFEMIF